MHFLQSKKSAVALFCSSYFFSILRLIFLPEFPKGNQLSLSLVLCATVKSFHFSYLLHPFMHPNALLDTTCCSTVMDMHMDMLIFSHFFP